MYGQMYTGGSHCCSPVGDDLMLLHCELNRTHAQNSHLQMENARLCADNEQLCGRNEHLQAENTSLVFAVQELRAKLQTVHDIDSQTTLKLQAANEERTQTIEDLRRKISKMRLAESKRLKDIKEATTAMMEKKMKDALAATESRNAALRDHLRRQDEEVQHLTIENEQMKMKLDFEQNHVNTLRQQMHFEDENRMEETRLADENMKALAKRNEELETHVSAMQQHMLLLTIDKDILIKEITDVHGLVNEALDSLNTFMECPISLETIENAIVASDGHVYDDHSVTKWTKHCQGRMISPFSHEPVSSYPLFGWRDLVFAHRKFISLRENLSNSVEFHCRARNSTRKSLPGPAM